MKIKYPNIIYQILTTMSLSSDDSASRWIGGDGPSPIKGSAAEEPQAPPDADKAAQPPQPPRRGLVHDLTREMRVQLGLEPPCKEE